MVATRERILTDNERYGSGLLDESVPGLWVVLGPGGHVAMIATNRGAAEAYCMDTDHDPGRTVDDYSIQVWAAIDEWPPRDEEDES